MIEHIQLCLDEIECELDAWATSRAEDFDRLIGLTSQMRVVMAGLMARRAAVSLAARDDLTLIRGIDDEISDHLASRGVTRYATVAAWSAADIASVAGEQVTAERMAAENWIEQAAILATGTMTHFARQLTRKRSEPDVPANPVPPNPIPAVVIADDQVGAVLVHAPIPRQSNRAVIPTPPNRPHRRWGSLAASLAAVLVAGVAVLSLPLT